MGSPAAFEGSARRKASIIGTKKPPVMASPNTPIGNPKPRNTMLTYSQPNSAAGTRHRGAKAITSKGAESSLRLITLTAFTSSGSIASTAIIGAVVNTVVLTAASGSATGPCSRACDHVASRLATCRMPGFQR